MTIEIRVPTLGESITEATVGKWFKKAGDRVAVDEPLLELETDKVTLVVNAPSQGVLASIVARDGETVTPGGLICQFEPGAGGVAADGKHNAMRSEALKLPPAMATAAVSAATMPPSPAAAKIA